MLSKTELESQLEAADRQLGRQSLFYFAKFVLGYKLMELKPHQEVCAFAESVVRQDRFGMDLEPRGSFKTTIFSQALPIWLIEQNPNIRILLDSAVLQNSIDNLGVISRHFEGNQKFRYLYGNFVGPHFTTEEITISRRTRTDLKEPTVRCASVSRVQVGPHYDVIVADDVVSEENSSTPEGRNSIKDHFRLLFSLLEPDGVMVLVGTRWNYDDLYGMIADEYPQFKTRVMQAIMPDKSLYFPQRLTQEFLDSQLKNQRREIFYCQYQNDPSPEDANSKFQRSWFKPFDRIPERRYGFIAIDPGGEKKGSDEWAIMTAYMDEESYLYYDKLLLGHYRSDKAWDILFDLLPFVKPLSVGLETTGGQKWLAEGLKNEMRRRNTYFNLVELPHAGDSKQYRILQLQPRYQAGSIFHSRAMGPLEEQLVRFPKGKDDVPDVASMILEIALAPSKKKVKQMARNFDEAVWQQVMRPIKQKSRHVSLGSEW